MKKKLCIKRKYLVWKEANVLSGEELAFFSLIICRARGLFRKSRFWCLWKWKLWWTYFIGNINEFIKISLINSYNSGFYSGFIKEFDVFRTIQPIRNISKYSKCHRVSFIEQRRLLFSSFYFLFIFPHQLLNKNKRRQHLYIFFSLLYYF